LVEVGLQDRALVVARLEDQRVQALVDLAGPGLLLSDPEQAAAGQLLGQCGGALLLLAGADVDQDRAQRAGDVDAVVAGEVAVFHGLQAGGQQLGDLLDPHQPPFFLALAIEGGDARRIQARGLDRLAGAGVVQARNLAAGQADLDPPRRHLAVDVGVATAGDGEARALDVVAALAPALAVLLVAGGVQFGAQGALVQRHARVQLQRARVDAGRDLPLQRAEALGHLAVEVDHVRDQEAGRQGDGREHRGQQVAAPGRAGALLLAVVVIVFAAWHVGYGRGNGRSLAAPIQGRDARAPHAFGPRSTGHRAIA